MEKVKVSHNETDTHTGWNGGMGDLRRGKFLFCVYFQSNQRPLREMIHVKRYYIDYIV